MAKEDDDELFKSSNAILDNSDDRTATDNAAGEMVTKPSRRDKLNRLLSEEFGEDFDPNDEDGAIDMLSNYIAKTKEQRQRLADALQQDPRLAQVLADVITGKRGSAGALARYFGKDFLAAEEGTPEYDEIIQAEEERKKEMADIAANEKAYKDNLEKSLPTVEQWCKQHGYEVDEFLSKAYDSIIYPVLQGTYSTSVLDFLDKGLNYDRDTEDALLAGEIKGRNTNIAKLRQNRGDGMPKGLTSATPNDNRKKTRSKSGLLGAALAMQEDYR